MRSDWRGVRALSDQIVDFNEFLRQAWNYSLVDRDVYNVYATA